MKLLVLSDSHRQLDFMMEMALRERPDTMIHLGDLQSDAAELGRAFQQLPLISLPGNCDLWTAAGEEAVRTVTLEGVTLYLTHGHQHQVKTTLLPLWYAAQEAGAQVALFGHTHRWYGRQEQNTWLFNPGAAGGYYPTCGILTLNGGKIRCQIKNEKEILYDSGN